MDSCFGLCCKFEGVPEHVVLVKPHGNARGGRQYTESAKLKLKDQLKTVGMGSPSKPFLTNDSELLNAVIKERTDYKKHQWPAFNEKMKQLVDLSQQEVEKAIVSTGKYKVREQYHHLIVDQKRWFRMTEVQHVRQLKKFDTVAGKQRGSH